MERCGIPQSRYYISKHRLSGDPWDDTKSIIRPTSMFSVSIKKVYHHATLLSFVFSIGSNKRQIIQEGNQKWTIQRNWQHRQEKQNKNNTQYVFTLRDMSTTSQKCCCSVMVIYQSSSACCYSEKRKHYQNQIANAMYSLMPTLCFYSAVF